jgi:hypothetical protein
MDFLTRPSHRATEPPALLHKCMVDFDNVLESVGHELARPEFGMEAIIGYGLSIRLCSVQLEFLRPVVPNGAFSWPGSAVLFFYRAVGHWIELTSKLRLRVFHASHDWVIEHTRVALRMGHPRPAVIG